MVLPHKLSDEELANFYEELKETFEALEQIEEYFSCILHDINSLILLFYLTYSSRTSQRAVLPMPICIISSAISSAIS